MLANHQIQLQSEIPFLLSRFFLNEEMQATDGDVSFLQTFIDKIESAVDLQIELMISELFLLGVCIQCLLEQLWAGTFIRCNLFSAWSTV